MLRARGAAGPFTIAAAPLERTRGGFEASCVFMTRGALPAAGAECADILPEEQWLHASVPCEHRRTIAFVGLTPGMRRGDARLADGSRLPLRIRRVAGGRVAVLVAPAGQAVRRITLRLRTGRVRALQAAGAGSGAPVRLHVLLADRVPMTRALAVLLVVAGLLAGCGDDGDGERSGGQVAERVEQQLGYLDPDSSAVVAIDMRYEERNWGHLRDIASRGLRAYREAAPPEERSEVPPNVSGVLNMLASFAGLSFDEDIKPLLDGYAVVGVTQRPVDPLPPEIERLRRKAVAGLSAAEQERLFEAQQRQDDQAEPLTVWTYRTEGDGLRQVVEKLAEGEKPKPVSGHEGVVTIAGMAIVDDQTLVFAEGPGDSADSQDLLRAALDRAKDDRGYPAARLADAEKAAGLDDPFVLAAGDTTIARATVMEPSLQRALREVRWLGAIRSLAGAIRLDERGAELAGTVGTDARALSDEDLPLAPAGDLDLPRNEFVTGASRDQSYTTTFLSRTARALFADSDFARAVERAERDIGVRFEDEVLRQFSCPSMSQFQPADRRFGARSCVKDPDRMRELLPELSKHLPRILTTMQRLDAQGLVGLLLIAPDAPLTPSFTQIAQIAVEPFEDAEPEETLYRVTGLRDDLESELEASLPDEVVFGLIGDTFVVGSDIEMARSAAKLSGDRVDEPAASAIRVPFEYLVTGTAGDDLSPEERALYDLLGEVRVTASADRAALRAKGRLDIKP